ncbi:non-ribosomal peptide synthetase [Millisia brevis]|uniref:non-ribosomal peptide synthetase n=1 Tax=Millisia brevis TaxID=264148 RepID=UPI00082CDA98|nr:non-ribosomal peptide synthetase [Millisia brevis]
MRALEAVEEAMRARLAREGLLDDVGDIPRRRLPDRAPLSSAQRGVWAFQQLIPGSVVYNLCLVLTFDGDVDDEALRRSFDALVARHEILRTTYHVDDSGVPYQLIASELSVPFESLDLTSLAPEAAQREWRREIDELVARPYDLSTEAPLRLVLARTGERSVSVALAIQHIAWDGMTLPALSRDIERFYRQALVGDIDAAPLDRQVADFAEYEHDRLDRDDHSAAADFWKQRFAGDLDALALPYDRRPMGMSDRGARRDRDLSPTATAALRGISRRLGATTFETFLAAYYLALRRITGQSDIVIGTTIANREEPGQELLIGNLSNMVALRYDSAPDARFDDVVARVRAINADTFRHKRYPYERAVADAKSVNSDIGIGLFETMVLFLEDRIDGPRLPGATTTWELIDNGSALLPIAVEVFVIGDRVDVQITYQSDLFDVETIDRLHEYIDEILTAADADTPIAELVVLSASDRDRIAGWAHGDDMAITPQTVDEMIRGSAIRTPERVAVVFNDIELTYAEFDRRVNQLARELLARGVRTADPIGVQADRSEWLPIAVAAIFRAGATYLPIDPDLPHDRVEFMVEDTRPVLVIRSLTEDRYPGDPGIPVIDLADADVREAIAQKHSDTPVEVGELDRPVHPRDAAYIIYTSGTTGRPKGVIIEHRSVANRVQWMVGAFDMIPDERVLQKTPIGFDVAVAEIVASAACGAALVLAKPGWWWVDPKSLADAIEQHKVTVVSFVPTMLRAFLDADIDPRQLESIRFLATGGESVSPWLAQEAGKVFGCPVLGLYGPTETTMDITYEDFSTVDPARYRSALIGLPESNSSVWVLDERLRPVPPGVEGELWLGGAQLARGYQGRPGRSASSFVSCPFGRTPGERMYRTGDLVRFNGVGRLEFVGRADDQVKISGHRIELGEVGTAVRQVPGVMSAAAIAVTKESGAALAAYYIADPGVTSTPAEQAAQIIAYLSQRLPAYLVPTYLVRMAALPFTANGKLDRKALPDPQQDTAAGNGRPLDGEREHLVAAVIRTALELPDDKILGADDDFLALGGDSIAAIRTASALRKRGLTIATRALFEARTIAGIAAATGDAAASDAPLLVPLDTDRGATPLGPVARALVDTVGADTRYCQATSVVLPDDADVERLTAALTAVQLRHPILGAHLGTDADGVPTFEIPTDADLPAVEVEDVTVEGDLGAALTEWTAILGERVDPVTGPMWATARVQGPAGRRLLLVIHHLVVDGVSWRILAEDLAAAWTAPAAPAAAGGTSLRAWNTSLVDLAAHPRITDQLDLWATANTIPELPVGNRPLDPTIDRVPTVREVVVTLDADTVAALSTDVAPAFGCDLTDLQVAALVVALADGRTDAAVSLTLERHGREEALFADADLSGTIGWFTTTYPITLDTDGTDIAATIRRVKERLGAIPDNGIGWGLLRRLNPDTRETLAGRPTPAVSFNYMGRFADPRVDRAATPWLPAPEVDFLAVHAADTLQAAAILDITTVALAQGDRARLEAALRFPEGAIDRDEVERIGRRWVAALTAAVDLVRTEGRRYLTPSDVRADGISQADLDTFERRHGRIDDVHPLTPMQEAIYLAGLAGADADVYCVQMLIGVRGALDTPRMIASLQRSTERYPNLRVSIDVTGEGRPVAVVPHEATIPVREIDLTTPTPAGDNPAIVLHGMLTDDLAEQFDLRSGPLLRAAVAHLPGEEHLLVLTAHHLVSDGWSGQLMPAQAFLDYVLGDHTVAPQSADTFAQFLTRIGEQREATTRAWEEYLADVRQACLVAPEHSGSVTDLPIEREFVVDADLTQRLRDVAAAAGTTVSTACQLAWATTLRLVTGRDTAVFGEAVAGRPADIDGVDTAVGSYANTVPRAIGIDETGTWADHLATIQRSRIPLMDLDHYPITAAHRVTGVRRLFDTMIAYQAYPAGRADLERLLGEADLELLTFSARAASEHAMLLTVFPEDGLRMVLSYAPGSFDEVDIDAVVAAFTGALDTIAAHPAEPIGAGPRLPEAIRERLEVLRAWR